MHQIYDKRLPDSSSKLHIQVKFRKNVEIQRKKHLFSKHIQSRKTQHIQLVPRLFLIHQFCPLHKHAHAILHIQKYFTAELQLNKANAPDTEAAFLDLNLSIHNDIVSTKMYENGMILILILLIFHFLMAMSLNVPLYFLVLRITPKSRAKFCAQWRVSLSPPVAC